MKTVEFKADDIIFRQGDEAESMYKIISGKVSIRANAKSGSKELAVLPSGKFFGEMGVIDHQVRSATAVAKTDVILLEIEDESFDKFAFENATDVYDIMQGLSERLRKTTKEYTKAAKAVEQYIGRDDFDEEIKKTPVWQKLTSIVRRSGLYFTADETAYDSDGLIKTNYEKGEIIFHQGQKGSIMYKIFNGEVGFFLKYGEAGETELARAGRGDIFGEMAVVEEERRSATAVAMTAVEIKGVANTEFLGFIEAYPKDAMKILHNISEKLRKTTKDYIDALKTLAEFEGDDNNRPGGGFFAEYARAYNDFLAGSDPFIMSYYHF